jgi:hypothetical protein
MCACIDEAGMLYIELFRHDSHHSLHCPWPILQASSVDKLAPDFTHSQILNVRTVKHRGRRAGDRGSPLLLQTILTFLSTKIGRITLKIPQ